MEKARLVRKKKTLYGTSKRKDKAPKSRDGIKETSKWLMKFPL